MGSPNFMIAGKDPLHFLRRKLMSRDVQDVLVVSVKPGNDHLSLA